MRKKVKGSKGSNTFPSIKKNYMFIGFPVYMVLWYHKFPLLEVCDKQVKKKNDWPGLTCVFGTVIGFANVWSIFVQVQKGVKGGKLGGKSNDLWHSLFSIYHPPFSFQDKRTCKTVLSILNRFWNSLLIAPELNLKFWKFPKSFQIAPSERLTEVKRTWVYIDTSRRPMPMLHFF